MFLAGRLGTRAKNSLPVRLKSNSALPLQASWPHCLFFGIMNSAHPVPEPSSYTRNLSDSDIKRMVASSFQILDKVSLYVLNTSSFLNS